MSDARRGIGGTQSSGSIESGDLFSTFDILFQMFIIFFYSRRQSGSLAQSITAREKQETIFGSSVATSWFPSLTWLEVESPFATVVSASYEKWKKRNESKRQTLSLNHTTDSFAFCGKGSSSIHWIFICCIEEI